MKRPGFSRRDMLKAAGAAFGLAAIGCNGDESPDPGPGHNTDYKLLAGIDTIVVLCMENRSFDHYLGARLLEEGSRVDGLTGDESNPAPDGSIVPVFRLDEFVTQDISHEWGACHAQFNNGKNDGFVTQHAGPNQNDPMGYHVRKQLPSTYQLADAFSVCDRWHASVMGPTWPNRFYLHGATSHGVIDGTRVSNFNSIFDSLEANGISTTNYFHDVPWAAAAYSRLHGSLPIEKFFEDARNGTLPQFTMIDPQFFGPGANDDHPDHDPQLGQALIASVYAAMAQSPQWARCLFVVTYDEHGGFYDHVAPGRVSSEDNPDFQQLGFRVPAIVAGPTVRKGATCSTLFDHVSVASTLTRRFQLPALNARVTDAADLSACLDPSISRIRSAPQLDAVEVSLSSVADRVGHAGDHPDIAAGIDRLGGHKLDRRADSRGITERVLRYGEQLGAVKLVY